jgi:hypothetical protein
MPTSVVYTPKPNYEIYTSFHSPRQIGDLLTIIFLELNLRGRGSAHITRRASTCILNT